MNLYVLCVCSDYFIISLTFWIADFKFRSDEFSAFKFDQKYGYSPLGYSKTQLEVTEDVDN